MSRSPVLHHIHKKKHHKITLTTFDHIMIVVAILYPLTMLPQIILIYSLQDAGSVSLLTYSLKFFFIIPWFAYGVLHKSKPIMCSNVMWFIMYAAIATEVIIY
jgi:uncharacterized protein with PQ loop repeat